MLVNKSVEVTASEDITRAGFKFSKGKSRFWAKEKLTLAQLAQIDAAQELTVVLDVKPKSIKQGNS